MRVRRVWAVTSNRDFYAFKARMREEQGLSMGQALAGLVHLVATGELTVDLSAHKELLEALQQEQVVDRGATAVGKYALDEDLL